MRGVEARVDDRCGGCALRLLCGETGGRFVRAGFSVWSARSGGMMSGRAVEVSWQPLPSSLLLVPSTERMECHVRCFVASPLHRRHVAEIGKEGGGACCIVGSCIMVILVVCCLLGRICQTPNPNVLCTSRKHLRHVAQAPTVLPQ